MAERAGRAVALVVLFPASAAVATGLVAVATWHRLPPVMTTHWGAGGADGRLPRAWAVGVPLAMSLVCAAWCLGHAYLHRRSPAATVDTAVVGGVFAWMGAMALASSVCLADHAGLVAALVLSPVAAGLWVYRYAGRAGLERRAVPGRNGRPPRGPAEPT